jgi:hypothetical protein
MSVHVGVGQSPVRLFSLKASWIACREDRISDFGGLCQKVDAKYLFPTVFLMNFSTPYRAEPGKPQSR